MKLFVFLFRALRIINFLLKYKFYTPITKLYFLLNEVKIEKGLNTLGLPYIMLSSRGKMAFGKNISINSEKKYNIIGRQQKTIFWVDGDLKIGNNVGISSIAIVCKKEIIIGKNVLIGGNNVIYDTDFHSINKYDRLNKDIDKKNTISKSVIIGDNVLFGSHPTILKGVNIGENSIIGACSVVSKNIPANEIWAENPIKYIKKV